MHACIAVMVCANLVNRHTHRQTAFGVLTACTIVISYS